MDSYHVDDTKSGADTEANNAIWTANKVKAITDTKAPLASPALTGAPTAPTPDAGDSSTKIATTAFAAAAMLATAIDGGTF